MITNMIVVAIHAVNWYAGWALILSGFATGAMLGMGFHRDDFWGGYASFRRRIARLGHIAAGALGMMNVLFAVAVPATRLNQIASILLLIGAVTMPAICFLTAWRTQFRGLFFIPVLCLFASVSLILFGGLS